MERMLPPGMGLCGSPRPDYTTPWRPNQSRAFFGAFFGAYLVRFPAFFRRAFSSRFFAAVFAAARACSRAPRRTAPPVCLPVPGSRHASFGGPGAGSARGNRLLQFSYINIAF